MKILVTGAAGFIGSYVSKRLAANHVVVGIDNINGAIIIKKNKGNFQKLFLPAPWKNKRK